MYILLCEKHHRKKLNECKTRLAHVTLTVLHVLVGVSLSKPHLDVEVCCAYLFVCL